MTRSDSGRCLHTGYLVSQSLSLANTTGHHRYYTSDGAQWVVFTFKLSFFKNFAMITKPTPVSKTCFRNNFLLPTSRLKYFPP